MVILGNVVLGMIVLGMVGVPVDAFTKLFILYIYLSYIDKGTTSEINIGEPNTSCQPPMRSTASFWLGPTVVVAAVVVVGVVIPEQES
jgi:hypothetical protein